MGKKFLASVANVELFKRSGSELVHIASAKTLTDSSVAFNLSMEEVRGGQGAKLYGRFGHTTGMSISMTDAMFDIQYIVNQLGAELENGGSVLTTKAVQSAPASLTLNCKHIGKIKGLDQYFASAHEVGKDDEYVLEVSADGATATIPAELQGKDICVSYFDEESSNKMIKVNANYIPAELVAVMTAQEFAGDASSPETGKPVGLLTVKLPRLQLDGNFDLSMNMSSSAPVSLNGTALAVEDASCTGGAYYAEIVEKLDGASQTDGIRALAIDNEYLKVGDAAKIYGLYSDGSARLLDVAGDNTGLTFDPASAINAGAWAAAGQVTVTVTGKTINDKATIIS